MIMTKIKNPDPDPHNPRHCLNEDDGALASSRKMSWSKTCLS